MSPRDRSRNGSAHDQRDVGHERRQTAGQFSRAEGQLANLGLLPAIPKHPMRDRANKTFCQRVSRGATQPPSLTFTGRPNVSATAGPHRTRATDQFQLTAPRLGPPDERAQRHFAVIFRGAGRRHADRIKRTLDLRARQRHTELTSPVSHHSRLSVVHGPCSSNVFSGDWLFR